MLGVTDDELATVPDLISNLYIQFIVFGGSCGRESAQVWTVVRLVHIIPVLVVIGQTPSDEFFTGVWDAGLLRKLNLSGIQDGLIPDYRHLRFIVAKWFHTEEELVKNYTNAPYVHLETK